MYGGDPFLTLTPWGRVGLVAVSAVLAGLWFFGVRRAMHGRSLPSRLAIVAFAFLAFVWLSPQAYYLYFMALFDGLPWQSVVKTPPSPRALIAFLAFDQRATLANHGVALLGWALFATALWR